MVSSGPGSRVSQPSQSTDRGTLELGRAAVGAVGLRTQILLALLTGLVLLVLFVTVASSYFVRRSAASFHQRERFWVESVLSQCVRTGATSQSALSGCLVSGGIEPTSIFASPRCAAPDHSTSSQSNEAAQYQVAGGCYRVTWRSHVVVDRLPVALALYGGLASLAILLLMYVLLTRLIVRPVERLTVATSRIMRGRLSERVEPLGASELVGLGQTLNQMTAQLASDREEIERRVQELLETTEELKRTQTSLVRSEKLASVGRLAAGIAHEIGNPLTAILGLVELLSDPSMDASTREEFLGRIKRETERIHRIIRQLLDFSRPQVEADSQASVVLAVEHAVSLVAPQKDLSRINIESRIPEDVPLVRGSHDQLTQVFLNLLLNAADAVGQGEGWIAIEVSPEESGVVVKVSDSGSGIPDDMKDRLFDPFVTSKEAGRGTGLGLSVCATMLEEVGGSISAQNIKGAGAQFTVTIPVVATRREEL